MSLSLLLSLAALAAAQDDVATRSFTWDISVQGAPAGHREVTVERTETASGTHRVLKGWTDLSTTVMGRTVSFKQRLTAHATEGPAAFYAAVETDGAPMEVQARRDEVGWVVTTVEPRRERSNDLPASAIDLSTADLLDPESTVPIWGFDEVRLLRAEDGQVWTTSVERLGSEEITVAGQVIPVEGYRLQPDIGRIDLWYDAGGVLVRYRWRWLTFDAEAVLHDAPPPAMDAYPVLLDAPVVTEEDL